jgi:hypothetical protein
MSMTAVELLHNAIKILESQGYSICNNTVRGEVNACREIERQQHQRTWDAAIEAYISRGVKERAIVDFDDYEIK